MGVAQARAERVGTSSVFQGTLSTKGEMDKEDDLVVFKTPVPHGAPSCSADQTESVALFLIDARSLLRTGAFERLHLDR